MTMWKSALVPLAFLALGACNGKDDDKTGDTDPVVTDETGETGDTQPAEFVVASVSYSIQAGIGPDGFHALKTTQGDLPPVFMITITGSAGEECLVVYSPKPEAFGTIAGAPAADTDVGGDTDTDVADTDTDAAETDVAETDVAETDAPVAGPTGLADFLDDNNLKFGFKVGPGLYDVVTDGPCDLIPSGADGFYQSDLAAELLSGADGDSLFIGFDNDNPTAEVLKGYTDQGVPAAHVFSGALQFPYTFTGPGNVTMNYFELAGRAGEVNDGWEPTIDAQGLFTAFVDAADIWADDAPAAAFYLASPIYGWTYTQ